MTSPAGAIAPVLLLIDLQKAIRDPKWGTRNNPDAEDNVRRLLAHWRGRDWPVIHVAHNSTDPASPYRPGQPGNDFLPGLGPVGGEPVVVKQVNSAFIGTDLQARLVAMGRPGLVVAGVITENSVEATVRMAGNLGYHVRLVEDACFTFGRRDWRGMERSADDVHAMALAILDGEYCSVTATDALLADPADAADTK